MNSLSPGPFTLHKSIDTLLFYQGQVLQVCITVVCLQEVEFLTFDVDIAVPAAFQTLFLAALPDLAEWRGSTISAPFAAPEFHHQPKRIIAFLVVLEGTPEG